jgi:hypothetical protein
MLILDSLLPLRPPCTPPFRPHPHTLAGLIAPAPPAQRHSTPPEQCLLPLPCLLSPFRPSHTHRLHQHSEAHRLSPVVRRECGFDVIHRRAHAEGGDLGWGRQSVSGVGGKGVGDLGKEFEVPGLATSFCSKTQIRLRTQDRTSKVQQGSAAPAPTREPE